MEDAVYRIHRFYLSKDTAISLQTTFVSSGGSVGMTRGREYMRLPRRFSDAEFPEAVRWSWSTRSAIKYRNAYGTNSFGFSFYNFGDRDVYERMWFIPIWIPYCLALIAPIIWCLHRYGLRGRKRSA